MSQDDNKQRKHVVIIGAGFGGVKAARSLANENVDITIVDRNNFHLFQPLLYQVSTAILAEAEIAYPVRAFFQKNKNVEFFLGEVIDFDLEAKKVITDHGEIGYDYLVIAAGSMTNYFGLDTLEKHCMGMKTLEESVRIRNHILNVFEKANKEVDSLKRKQLLTFICVGGGPTGVEEAGSLSELIYHVMAKEYHNLDFSQVDIKLIEATDTVLPMMPANLRDETVHVLQRKKVDVRLNSAVLGYDGTRLTLQDGEVIPTQTVIWAAGVKSVPIIAKLGEELDRSGRVIVQKTLQLIHHPEVFAIGDNACFIQDGRPLATIAPVATQAALLTAANIMKMIHGQTVLDEFSYKDVGSMATIGRGDAVMFKGTWQMKGFFAWCAWMVVHLMRLAGTHTNITVALKWMWNFFSGTRLGRIITKE